jgi:hypothetical protein
MNSNEHKWWMDWPMEKHHYREYKDKPTKADKVRSTMIEINKIKESMRPQRKADRGIAIIKGAIK